MSTTETRLGLPWQSRVSAARAAVLCMAGFGLGWAIVEDVFGAGLQHPYGLVQIVWMRYAVHLLIVLGVWGWTQPSRIWRTERPVFHLARSLLMLVMPLSFGWALARGVPASLTWALFWLAPLMGVLLGIGLLRERASASIWIGIVLGTLGVVAILSPPMPAHPGIPTAPLVMALSFSVYVLMTRLLRNEHVAANMFYTAAGVFAILTPFVLRSWVTPSMHDLAMFVGIGAIGFVSLLALDRALSHASISATSPALYSQVAFSAVIGMVMSGRTPSHHVLVGIVLIAGAAALAWAFQGAKDPP